MTTWYGYKNKMETLRKYAKDSDTTVSELLSDQLKSLIEGIGNLNLAVLSSKIEKITVDGFKGVSPEMNKYRNDEITNLINTLQGLLKEKGYKFAVSSLMNWVVELILGKAELCFLPSTAIEDKLMKLGNTIDSFYNSPENILSVFKGINDDSHVFKVETVKTALYLGDCEVVKEFWLRSNNLALGIHLIISENFFSDGNLKCYLNNAPHTKGKYTVSVLDLSISLKDKETMKWYPSEYIIKDSRPTTHTFIVSWETPNFKTVDEFFNRPLPVLIDQCFSEEE